MDTPQEKLITEDDLLALDAQDKRFEVIDGELVEMSPVGHRHSEIVGNLFLIIKLYLRQNSIGLVHGDSLLFVLSQSADSEGSLREARSPDLAFVRKSSYPDNFDRTRPFPGAPDLAVEVVSPTESASELQAKIHSYLSHGTQEVWAVYPEAQEIYVHDKTTPDAIRVYRAGDTLSPENLLPGLKIAINDIFAEEAI